MFISQLNTPRCCEARREKSQPWAHVSQRCLGTRCGGGTRGGFLEEVAFEVGLEDKFAEAQEAREQSQGGVVSLGGLTRGDETSCQTLRPLKTKPHSNPS